MKLYRIKKADSPLYFGGWRWYDMKQIWSKDGAFYKCPETIIHHLEVLCSDRVTRRDFPQRCAYNGVGFDRRRLKNYKVIIDEVQSLSRRGMGARKFLKEFSA
jgi:hypothetical protein